MEGEPVYVGRRFRWWEETDDGGDGSPTVTGAVCQCPMIFVPCQIELPGKPFFFFSNLAEVWRRSPYKNDLQVMSDKLWKVLRHMYLMRIFAPAQRIADGSRLHHEVQYQSACINCGAPLRRPWIKSQLQKMSCASGPPP